MNTILGIYLGTILVSNIMVELTEAAYHKRLEREGYRDLNREISVIEKINDFIKFEIFMIIPILNIAFAAFVFFGDLYNDLLSEGLEKGTIIKKSKEEIEQEKEKKQEKRRRKEEVPTIQEEKRPKTYLEMTDKEKIAVLKRELEWLQSINRHENTSDKSYNDRGAYKK